MTRSAFSGTLTTATLTALVSLVSCGAPPKIDVLAPGVAAMDLRDHGPVAVVLAEAPRGGPRARPSPGVRHFPGDPQGLADALVESLVRVAVPLVERGRFNAVINEVRVSRSDLFDPDVAARIGRQLGASTIVSVRVYEWGQDVSTWRVERQRGETFTGKINIGVRAVDVGTGAIIAATSVEETHDLGSYAPGEGSSKANRRLAELEAPAIDRIVRHLVPVAQVMPVALFRSTPGLEAGNRAARIGSWEDAERLYSDALASLTDEKMRDEATFNVAVARVYLRKYDAARALLRELFIRKEYPWVQDLLDECERRAALARSKATPEE
jgi:hypothetical protein